MTCQVCGLEAPTKSIKLYQNIGMVITRQWAHVEGNLCRRCIARFFKSYTLTTLFPGWWGLISFLVTPLILLNNVVRYLGSLGLPEPGIEALNTPLAATAAPFAGGGRAKASSSRSLTAWSSGRLRWWRSSVLCQPRLTSIIRG